MAIICGHSPAVDQYQSRFTQLPDKLHSTALSTTLYCPVYYIIQPCLLHCTSLSTTLYCPVYYIVLTCLLHCTALSTTFYCPVYYAVLRCLLHCTALSTTLYCLSTTLPYSCPLSPTVHQTRPVPCGWRPHRQSGGLVAASQTVWWSDGGLTDSLVV